MRRISDEDLIRIYGDRYDLWTRETKKNRVVGTYYWGDEVDIIDVAEADDPLVKEVRVRHYNYGLGRNVEGVIKKRSAGKVNGVTNYRPFKWRADHLLETTFIDVQQGDATLIRTPDRKLILVDGGEGKFVARLLASVFPGTSPQDPLILDALVITHGDADHFSGLVQLAKAANHELARKRIHVRIARYFHNGLVKPPGSIEKNGKKRRRKEKEKLGAHKKFEGKTYATGIWDDPRNAPELNERFTDWKEALPSMLLSQADPAPAALPNENLPRIQRLEFGQHQAFDVFRDGDVDIEVIGPLVDDLNGTPGMEFLKGDSGISASHTINGHSVVLRLRLGNVRFLLGGDLNTHSQERLLERVNETDGVHLRSEILKVPHHGSHEFDYDFLEKVSPVVSVVSCGDENAMKEYVHPRANLMAALGLCSRKPRPLVFSTELAAFFAYRGPVQPELHRDDGHGGLEEIPEGIQRGTIHAFQRLIFGAVRVRTDGKRVVVAVESASDGVKEAYAFFVDEEGDVTPDEVTLY